MHVGTFLIEISDFLNPKSHINPTHIPRTQSMLHTILISDCVKVINVDLWPSSEGLYQQDDSLEVCDNDPDKPRYRQIGGDSFLWSDATTNYWWGSNTICHKAGSNTTLYFFSLQGGDTPDLVPAIWWFTGNRDGDSADNKPTVVACGKL